MDETPEGISNEQSANRKQSSLTYSRLVGEVVLAGIPLVRFGRYTAKWRCQCGCRMLADLRSNLLQAWFLANFLASRPKINDA